jgi:hypothetical protein
VDLGHVLRTWVPLTDLESMFIWSLKGMTIGRKFTGLSSRRPMRDTNMTLFTLFIPRE